MKQADLCDLLLKYHAPGGRYTYFPRISGWSNDAPIGKIKEEIISLNESDVYLHIPFCESVCTFCGCNIKVTKDKSVQDQFLDILLKEWTQIRELNPDFRVNSLYIGGGTPNFLSPQNLETIITSICTELDIPITIEADPRFLDDEYIELYRELKIRRVILGVQDLDTIVLQHINREQNKEQLLDVVNKLSTLNLEDLCIELIYGLPYQKEESLSLAINELQDKVTSFLLYPLAPVPWQSKVQKAYGDYTPLSTKEMYKVFVKADKALEEREFKNHSFGLYSKKDSYFSTKPLKRNITGFTPWANGNLIGIGPSAISKLGGHLKQNEKVLEKYYLDISRHGSSCAKSHTQTKRDQSIEQEVLSLIQNKQSNFLTEIKDNPILNCFSSDRFIEHVGQTTKLTSSGLHFIKYICQIIENKIS